METYPPNEELRGAHTFSARFNRRINRLFKVMNKPYYPFVNTAKKRAAAAAALIIMFAGLMNVKAIREPVFNFLMEIYERFTRIIFNTGQPVPAAGVGIEAYYQIALASKGYSIESETVLPFLAKYEYISANGDILVFEQFLLNEMRVVTDTEGIAVENVIINGFGGVYFYNNGYNNMIWDNGEYGFKLLSVLDRELLIEIAESVEKK